MKAKANFKTANEPTKFLLFVGNAMYECNVLINKEKAIKVQRTPVDFKGGLMDSNKKYNWYPKAGLLHIREDEFELAHWV
jgi:hypothetical protein